MSENSGERCFFFYVVYQTVIRKITLAGKTDYSFRYPFRLIRGGLTDPCFLNSGRSIDPFMVYYYTHILYISFSKKGFPFSFHFIYSYFSFSFNHSVLAII